MKVVGIIAEYNPFHLGHKYQIDYARKELHADYVVVVMSGPFTQRGTPAIFDKYTRAKHAMSCGADFVIELPVIYATSSAEFFALGGVSVLLNTGVVDTLLFGSETEDLAALKEIATILVEEPEAYKAALQKELQLGNSFATARANALNNEKYQEILSSPNNILAVEYLKALIRLNAPITPVCLKRKGSDYHDETLSSPMASATAIRKSIAEKVAEKEILKQLPEELHLEASNIILAEDYLMPEDISSLLHYELISHDNFQDYFDCNHDISNKILHNLHKYAGFDSFCHLLKSKDLTYTRISRILCHILLNIKDDDLPRGLYHCHSHEIAPYLRVLGFRDESKALLSHIKAKGKVPLFTTPKDAYFSLSEASYEMLKKDIFAADVYRIIQSNKTHIGYPNEFNRLFIPFTK